MCSATDQCLHKKKNLDGKRRELLLGPCSLCSENPPPDVGEGGVTQNQHTSTRQSVLFYSSWHNDFRDANSFMRLETYSMSLQYVSGLIKGFETRNMSHWDEYNSMLHLVLVCWVCVTPHSPLLGGGFSEHKEQCPRSNAILYPNGCSTLWAYPQAILEWKAVHSTIQCFDH